MSTKKPYMVGWVRASARHPLGEQVAKMRDAGVDKVYGIDKTETAMDAVKHISGRGPSVIMVTSLARLGSSREAIRDVVAAAHERGAVIVEMKTGRRSDDSAVAVQMAMDAADEIAADYRAFTRHEARHAANKRWSETERKPRTSVCSAMRVWKDTENFPTIPQVLEHVDCAGWTQTALYKAFGRRWPDGAGRGGRPRAHKKHDAEPPELRVYFIKHGRRMVVKIGVSNNVDKRLSALTTSSGERLTCLATIEGGYGLEKALHRQFAKYRIKGEWFKLEGELAAYIKSLPPY